MANSEKSYRDRQGKAQMLHDAVSEFEVAKMAADKLRGLRPPRTPTPPPPDPPGPADGTRNRGEQAYVELAAHLGAFIAVVATCPGYAPATVPIKLATLTASHTAFTTLNGTLCASATGLSTAREARRLLYDRPGCLAEQFKLIKAAVKGQYGPNSAPWAVVEGIKW